MCVVPNDRLAIFIKKLTCFLLIIAEESEFVDPFQGIVRNNFFLELVAGR